MVNKELIDLCRLVVAAIQESDGFDAAQLRKLLMHIVPQLLAEIDILQGVMQMLRQEQEQAPAPAEGNHEPLSAAAAPEPAPQKRHKKPARQKSRRKGKR